MLPYVEDGTVTLIGATTENPSFEVNSALLSRSRVFVLHALARRRHPHDRRARADRYGARPAARDTGHASNPTALEHLVEPRQRRRAGRAQHARVRRRGRAARRRGHRGDRPRRRSPMRCSSARATTTRTATRTTTRSAPSSRRCARSDPDAAVYYLARMIESGEDPLFIARRLVIFASEDVGLADPQALQLAIAAQQSVHFIGMPEGFFPLAHATLYLATAPKSNTRRASVRRRAGRRRVDPQRPGAAAPAQRADAADEAPRLRQRRAVQQSARRARRAARTSNPASKRDAATRIRSPNEHEHLSRQRRDDVGASRSRSRRWCRCWAAATTRVRCTRTGARRAAALDAARADVARVLGARAARDRFHRRRHAKPTCSRSSVRPKRARPTASTSSPRPSNTTRCCTRSTCSKPRAGASRGCGVSARAAGWTPAAVAAALRPERRRWSRSCSATTRSARSRRWRRSRRWPTRPARCVHTDAVATAGYLELDLRGSDVDLLSLSAHKFNGPKGRRRAVRAQRHAARAAQIVGGGQEHGLRAGTENVAGIAGSRARLALAAPSARRRRRASPRLRDRLAAAIAAARSGDARARRGGARGCRTLLSLASPISPPTRS